VGECGAPALCGAEAACAAGRAAAGPPLCALARACWTRDKETPDAPAAAALIDFRIKMRPPQSNLQERIDAPIMRHEVAAETREVSFLQFFYISLTAMTPFYSPSISIVRTMLVLS
jgi:hypothetical protein